MKTYVIRFDIDLRVKTIITNEYKCERLTQHTHTHTQAHSLTENVTERRQATCKYKIVLTSIFVCFFCFFHRQSNDYCTVYSVHALVRPCGCVLKCQCVTVWTRDICFCNVTMSNGLARWAVERVCSNPSTMSRCPPFCRTALTYICCHYVIISRLLLKNVACWAPVWRRQSHPLSHCIDMKYRKLYRFVRVGCVLTAFLPLSPLPSSPPPHLSLSRSLSTPDDPTTIDVSFVLPSTRQTKLPSASFERIIFCRYHYASIHAIERRWKTKKWKIYSFKRMNKNGMRIKSKCWWLAWCRE